MDVLNEVKVEVKELRIAVVDLSKQMAVNNHILSEHHKRSTMLEEAMKPIEAHVALVSGLTKVLGVMALVTGLVASILKISEWFR